MWVTLDHYWVCIGWFNSFRVIKCRAYFWATFFHYCLKFLMFSVLPFFKYFLISSFNSVAAEFQFFYMLYSYCIIMQSWDIEANSGLGGWRSFLSLFVCHWNLNSIWVEDFSKLTNFSLFKCPLLWYLLSYRDFFRLFDFFGGSETSNWKVQTFSLQWSF